MGGFTNGKLIDHNYKITAREIGHTINHISGDDLAQSPIERARTRNFWVLLVVFTAGLIGYGWVLEGHGNVSIPLMLQLTQNFLGTCIYNIFNTLVVDVFPGSPSTAAATASITRCALAAIGVGVLQPLLDVLGLGWYFTVLSTTGGVAGLAAVWAIRSCGMEWRSQRLTQTTHTASRDAESGETRPGDGCPGIELVNGKEALPPVIFSNRCGNRIQSSDQTVINNELRKTSNIHGPRQQ